METEELSFVVTHFYRRSPYVHGWIQADFVTQIIGSGSADFYFGIPNVVFKRNNGTNTLESRVLQAPINPIKLKDDKDNGSLIKLPAERLIQKNESIWIAPDQAVYIANSYDPSVSISELVYKDNITSTYSLINQTVNRLVRQESIEYAALTLKPYMTKDYWETLLSIVLKDLKGNNIKEGDFDKVGFIFPALDNMYRKSFTRLMNEHNAAYSNDGLVRFSLNLEFVKWPVKKSVSEDKEKTFRLLANSSYFQAENPVIEFKETPIITLEEEAA